MIHLEHNAHKSFQTLHSCQNSYGFCLAELPYQLSLDFLCVIADVYLGL
jgi:hypothetical protein